MFLSSSPLLQVVALLHLIESSQFEVLQVIPSHRRVARTSTLSDLSGTARPSSRPESQSAHAGGHEKQHDGAWIRLHGAEFGFVLQV